MSLDAGYYRISRVRDLGGVVFYHGVPFSNQPRGVQEVQFMIEQGLGPDYATLKKNLVVGAIIATEHRPEISGPHSRYHVTRVISLKVPENFPKLYPTRPILDKGLIYKDPVRATISSTVRKALILKAAAIRRSVGATLESQGFLQINTPVLQVSSAGSAARCFKTRANYNDKTYCLRTSHEFPGKKLLAMGFDKVVLRGPCFRNQDLGPRHSFEYQGLEAYYTDHGDPQTRLSGLRALIQLIFRNAWYAATGDHHYGQQDLRLPWPVYHWKQELSKAQVTRDQLEKQIKANLGRYPPLFHLCGLPVSASPLAHSDGKVAYNLETYVQGLQVFDSYLEENRAQILRRNWQLSQEKGYLDLDFLNVAKTGFPPATGLGLGVDRLCLAILKAKYADLTLRDIKAFPFY